MDPWRNDRPAPRRANRRCSRRWALRGAAGFAAAAVAPWRLDRMSAQARPPVAGPAVPELAAFDATMTRLMAEWNLPGGQLALAKDGRLVFDRGYGWADVEAEEPVRPESLCRVASVSKAITTVAVLALVDDGKLALDDRAFRILDRLEPPANAPIDPRLNEITIEHLLTHAGGWDSSTGFDPQEQPWTWREAGILGAAAPPSAEEIVRAMLGEPLAFDPGARSVYSNFGFNVLGRVIEGVSGRPYEAFVRERVLAPAGAARMRIGRTRRDERAPGEVRYYAPPGQGPFPSVFPGEGYAPAAYGAFFLESMDAHGGWIASAADLLCFATAVDGQRGPALLRPATVEAMLRTPRPAAAAGGSGAGNAEPGMGLGWIVLPAGDGVDWSHAGALIGSSTAWLARTQDGLAVAFAFNSMPADAGGLFGAAIPALQQAVAEVTAWPEHDLFSADG